MQMTIIHNPPPRVEENNNLQPIFIHRQDIANTLNGLLLMTNDAESQRIILAIAASFGLKVTR